MQKTRKIPQRQCVGCREMKDKKALLRIVKTPEGEILLDATGKKSGRGAYVCPDPECLKKARWKGRWWRCDRAFVIHIGTGAARRRGGRGRGACGRGGTGQEGAGHLYGAGRGSVLRPQGVQLCPRGQLPVSPLPCR